MEQRRFGASGVMVPVVGQGTWQIEDNESVERTLRRGLELGMTHIDTAELYTGAEEVVGRVIAGCRDQIFLVSKVLPAHGSYQGTIAACEASLKKLKTDHLDCYLLHWHEGQHPIAETMEAMLQLQLQGKIRHIGVSNFSVGELEEAQHALGEVPLVCNQVRYNLHDRAIEDSVISWCQEHDVAVVGYSPYGTEAGGFVSSGTAAWAALEAVAERHCRTVRQVALRYLSRQSHVFAIPKASRVDHVEENAGGQGFELTRDDLQQIEAAFPW